jgi:hypothetical protein
MPLHNSTSDFGFLGLQGAGMDPLLGREFDLGRTCDSIQNRPFHFAGDENEAEGTVQNLRAELDRVRADRDRLAAQQAEIMRLLNVANPDKLLHDIRNLLNERELFKALTESLED